MGTDNSVKNLSAEEAGLHSRIFSLVIGRVFKKVYSSLSESERLEIQNVLISGTEKDREESIKKYIPDFEKIFLQEAKKIEQEVKAEIEKQF